MAIAKEPKRAKLCRLREYLEDPDNPFPSRSVMAVEVLGYSRTNSLYRLISPKELGELEREALEERKRRSAKNRATLYDVLYEVGKAGDVSAIKEYLNRTEGPVETRAKMELTGKEGGPVEVSAKLPEELLAMIRYASTD